MVICPVVTHVPLLLNPMLHAHYRDLFRDRTVTQLGMCNIAWKRTYWDVVLEWLVAVWLLQRATDNWHCFLFGLDTGEEYHLSSLAAFLPPGVVWGNISMEGSGGIRWVLRYNLNLMIVWWNWSHKTNSLEISMSCNKMSPNGSIFGIRANSLVGHSISNHCLQDCLSHSSRGIQSPAQASWTLYCSSILA